MAFADRVLLLMNSAAFLQIAGVAAAPGGGGGGGAGGGGAAPVRQPVGVPENIPELTFIANPLPGDNGFIVSANEFHNNFGLSPIGVNSLEDILIRLQTTSTPIRCMRIVTHANFDHLFMWLFNNGSRGILAGPLAGFASSDADGLAALITQYTAGASISPFLFEDRANQALAHLRTNNAAVLVPFGLDQPADTLTADQRVFFRRNLDLVFITGGTIDWDHSQEEPPNPTPGTATTAEKDVVRASINTIITHFQTRFVGLPIRNTANTISEPQVQALRAALTSLTLSDIGLASASNTFDGRLLLDLRQANRVIAAGLRAKITHARARFSKTSRIDIRGCRVAQGGHTNLQAMQAFFGTTGNLPMVTGPNWLQSFTASFEFASNSLVDGLVSSGIPGANVVGTDIDTAFSDWRDLVNFQSFFQFITGLIQGNAFNFTTLTWRQRQATPGGVGIPLLNMEAQRADDLPTMNLADLIQRFRTIGDISTATPTTASRTRLGSLQPRVATFAQIQQRVSAAAAPTSADLTQFFNDLKTVYTGLIGVTGVTAPNPRLIPATAPNPLDLPTIQGYVTAIRGFIDTTLATNYGTFFTDVNTAMQATNGPLKFYLAIGLPLLIQSSSHPARHTILLDNTLKTSAMRNFLKLLWTSDTSQLATMTTRINALTFNWDANTDATRAALTAKLRIPAVHQEHADTDPSAFAPTAAYNIHIVVEPATP